MRFVPFSLSKCILSPNVNPYDELDFVNKFFFTYLNAGVILARC